ncbi:Flagellar capping protein FliD [Mariprofundus ferrinatatus]|uniref:Flagellar hook-associated protein 2 n=1 Tax=Mariprofundus ferrinatatus TaxID=1921087 RepID=A0A2K8L9M8_9PROT|nr:flagellar filament capping protein FliD [Mariprofundus ferrinatatus]ATX82959.1 Flagellar capping protein FliD [Mariprofundus ferrinatatus]
MVSSSSISGLSSGIDSANIVDQLMKIEGRKVTLLQDKQADELIKQRLISQLDSSLSSLRSKFLELANQANFLVNQSTLGSNTATSADSLLTVTPSSSAAAGSHTIKVNQLAAAEKLGSSSAVKDSTGTAITSDTAGLGYTAGTFTIQGKSASAKTINVASTDSLRDIRDKINQLNTGSDATGVSASILKVGASDFRLILAADDTGLTNGVVNLAGTDLDAAGGLANLQLGAAAQGNARQTLQAAADASIDVDNLTISRESNSISDALAGYTLDLKSADPATTITVNTSVDTAAVKGKVQAVVDSYNEVMDFINTQMTFNPDTKTSGPLANESLLRQVKSQLAGSLLSTVSGLASDRNSLAMIGVEPDSKGHLGINSSRLDNLLSTDPNSVRDLFAASGTSNNSALEFLTYGANTVAGSYAVNITAAALQATVTGTTDLSGGLAGAEQVTITDGSARQAVVNLTNGQSLSSIVSALNAEFTATYTEQRQMSTALVTGLGTPATSASLLQDLTDGAGGSLGIVAGDTITIGGTNRFGSAVNYTFTVADPATDTIADLLASIQVEFGQNVAASLNASGQVTITDNQSGDSNLTLSMTANNEGGGSLAFGADTVVQEGRHAMQLSASASGNFLQLQSNDYGSAESFTVAQSANNLGIIDQTYAGQDVAGTIGGIAATGNGQVLTGSSGNIDGLLLAYSGTATGAVGTMSVNLGLAAQMSSTLEAYTFPVTGLTQMSVDSSVSTYDSLQSQIDSLTLQLDKERERLMSQFLAMERFMSQSNATGAWLSQQITAMSANQR